MAHAAFKPLGSCDSAVKPSGVQPTSRLKAASHLKAEMKW